MRIRETARRLPYVKLILIRARIENEISIDVKQEDKKAFSIDFTNPELEKELLFLNYKHISKSDKLVLTPAENGICFAAVRQPDICCSVKTVCDFNGSVNGAEAGIMVYLQSDFNHRICKKSYADGDYIVVKKYAEDFSQTIYKRKTQSCRFTFQINADKDYYYFYCSENNIEKYY